MSRDSQMVVLPMVITAMAMLASPRILLNKSVSKIVNIQYEEVYFGNYDCRSAVGRLFKAG